MVKQRLASGVWCLLLVKRVFNESGRSRNHRNERQNDHANHRSKRSCTRSSSTKKCKKELLNTVECRRARKHFMFKILRVGKRTDQRRFLALKGIKGIKTTIESVSFATSPVFPQVPLSFSTGTPLVSPPNPNRATRNERHGTPHPERWPHPGGPDPRDSEAPRNRKGGAARDPARWANGPEETFFH